MSMSLCSVLAPNTGPRKTGPPGLQRLGLLRQASGCFDPRAVPELLRLLDDSVSPDSVQLRPIGLGHSAWLLEPKEGGRCDRCGWMIKQVSNVRRKNLPTELENCDQLLQKFPTLVSDPSLAFPHSSVELQSETYEHTKDLLISRMCPGVQLGRYVADLDLRKPQDQEQLEAVAMKIGELLAEFHLRYTDPVTGEPTYHTDFHPSNVLYDAKTETLSIIDLEGMGSLGITDDVEKFERLLWGMAGERYASAFHLRYTALAPKVAASRSSTKSTATGMSISSEDLYPADASVVTRLRRGNSFKTLSSLAVGHSGFHPQQSLVTLAWLVSPFEKLTEPTLWPVRKKAWMLYQKGQKECWYLQHVAASVEGVHLQRCEEFVRRFPEVLNDENLAFPHSVIPLQMGIQSCGRVFVANCPCNTTLEQYFADCRESKKDQHLKKLLFKVGEQLSKTLSKYRCSDPNGNGPNGPATAGRAGLRPSCVLYDAQRDVITFADFVWSDELHGMSCVDRLCEALRPFADERYAEELRAGYAKTARCRGRRADCSGQQACFTAPCSPRSECSEDSDGQMARSNLCPTM